MVEVNVTGVSMGVEQLYRGRKQELWVLLIVEFVMHSNGVHYNHLYSKMLFVFIPILQKTREVCGWLHRMAESLAALRAEPQFLSP